MPFARVKLAGWATNDPFTSAQANQLDIDHAAAMDQPLTTLQASLPSALSWPIRGTTTNSLSRSAFGAKDQVWFATGTGGTDFGEWSVDFGRTWTNIGMASGLTFTDSALDASGNVAIITSIRTVVKGTRTAYSTWAWGASVNMLTTTSGGSSLDFDATSGNFIAVYRPGASGFNVDTTTDPAVAWTSRTVPSGTWTAGYTGSNNPEITCIPGRAIAVFCDAATPRLNLMWSSNGGVTWANVQQTLTMAAAQAATSILSKPAYDSARAEWYVAIAGTVGTKSTEVYRSTDGGLSWAQTANLTSKDWASSDIAAIGDLLVMTNYDGRIAYSIDRGVTWKLGIKYVGASTRMNLRSGGGGFITLNPNDKIALASVRTGDNGMAL